MDWEYSRETYSDDCTAQERFNRTEEILDFANMVFSVAYGGTDFGWLLPKAYAPQRSGLPIHHMIRSRGRGRIRALIDLAENAACGSIQLSEVADRNGISVKYLEQIFASLRKTDIIRSTKGPQGGYSLARPPEHIKIEDVLAVLEGSCFLEAEEALIDGKGETEAHAVQTEIIEPVNGWIARFFSTLTLKKLVESSEKQKNTAQNMYYI